LRETVLFGNNPIPKVDPPNLIVRFIDDRNLIRPLDDLHRIATGTQHGSRHSCAQTVASRSISGSRDETLIFLHLCFCFWPQRQFRLGPTSPPAAARTAGTSVCGPNTS